MVMADRPDVKTAPVADRRDRPARSRRVDGQRVPAGAVPAAVARRRRARAQPHDQRDARADALVHGLRDVVADRRVPLAREGARPDLGDRPAAVGRAEHVTVRRDTIAGVPGLWFRPRDIDAGTEDAVPPRRRLHRHVAEHVHVVRRAARPRDRAARSSSPTTGWRPSSRTPRRCDDALDVLAALRDATDPATGARAEILVAGDSGGGGLAGSVLYECGRRGLPVARPGCCSSRPRSACVFDEPSVTENAPYDVLPWNIPTNSYLHGLDPRDVAVSGSDVTSWPPTFIAYGGDEIFRDPIRASRRTPARRRRRHARARAAGNVPCLPGARAVGGVEPGDVRARRRVRRPHRRVSGRDSSNRAASAV